MPASISRRQMCGQLVDPGAEQVDALAAGDLGVEAELLGHLAEGDELVGGDLAARHPGDHRVGAVPLEVGQEVVVGVLEGGLLAVEDVAVAQRRQHRRHRRLADLAALALAVAGEQLGERGDAGAPARGRTAPGGCRRSARTGCCSTSSRPCAARREELGDQGDAAAAAGAGLGALLDVAHVVAARRRWRRRSSPLSTLLQEQIMAVSDRAPTPTVGRAADPVRAGKMSSSGCSGVGMSPRTICTSVW